MKVLAVSAHPDDLELLCAGTLARYAAEGHEVTMCNAALGDRGSFVHTSTEIAEIRMGEAKASAALIGATHRTLGLSDGEVNASDPRQRLLAVDLIRASQPDIIITHSPLDYMPDHVEVGRLMLDASHIATLPLLETDLAAHDRVAAVYYMDTLAGVAFQPSEYVDISDFLDKKLEMLARHSSQIDWMRSHDGIDILEQTRIHSAFRGYQSGVGAAEAFTPCLTHLRTRTARLLP